MCRSALASGTESKGTILIKVIISQKAGQNNGNSFLTQFVFRSRVKMASVWHSLLDVLYRDLSLFRLGAYFDACRRGHRWKLAFACSRLRVLVL